MRNITRILFVVAAVAAAKLGLVETAALGLLPMFMGETTATTDIDEAMKVLFEDSITESHHTESEVLDIFKEDLNVKTDITTGGRYIETAQLFQLPAGVGARAEGEYIPVPKGPVVVNSRINLKKVFAVLEMTGDTMDLVRTQEGAFMNYAEEAMPLIAKRLAHESDRMALGFGSGILGRVNDATPQADDLNVDSSFGVTGFSKAWTLFKPGMSVVFGPNANGTSLRDSGASAEVTDVDPATGNISVDVLPSGVLDNDYIFPGDSSGNSAQTAAGVNREYMGLLGIVDDGGILATFQNIPRPTYRQWQGIVHTVGGALTEAKLLEADDTAYEISGARGSVIIVSRAASRAYWADVKGDRSINDPRGNFGGQGLNRKGLTIHLGDRMANIRVARKLPDELGFILDPSTLKRFQNKTFEWDARDGSIWKRVTDGNGRKDAFYAVGYERMELACSDPRMNIRLDDIG